MSISNGALPLAGAVIGAEEDARPAVTTDFDGQLTPLPGSIQALKSFAPVGGPNGDGPHLDGTIDLTPVVVESTNGHAVGTNGGSANGYRPNGNGAGNGHPVAVDLVEFQPSDPTPLNGLTLVPVPHKNRIAGFDFTPPVAESPNANPKPPALGDADFVVSTPAPSNGNGVHARNGNGVVAAPAPLDGTVEAKSENIGRFVVHGSIGSGGMGRVFNANDPNTDRDVAIKVPHDLDERASDGVRKTRDERFTREAKIVAQLEHPNILPIHEILKREDDGTPYYVMRKVTGPSLTDLIRRFHDPEPGVVDRPDIGQLFDVFIKICHATEYAHSKGIFHLDIKPDNVLTDRFGVAYLADWGLALVNGEPIRDEEAPNVKNVRGQGKTSANGVSGTPEYMAPEQARLKRERLDARADVYALGAILYHIISGVGPRDHFTKKVTELEKIQRISNEELHKPVASSRVVRRPKDIIAVIEAATIKDRAKRYQSVAELRVEVEKYLHGEKPEVARWNFVDHLKKWASSHPVRATALFVGGLVGTIGGVAALGLKAEADRETAVLKADADRETAARVSTEIKGKNEFQATTDQGLKAAKTDNLEQAKNDFSKALGCIRGHPEEKELASKVLKYIEVIQRNQDFFAKSKRAIALAPDAWDYSLGEGDRSVKGYRAAIAVHGPMGIPNADIEVGVLSPKRVDESKQMQREVNILLAMRLKLMVDSKSLGPDSAAEAKQLIKQADSVVGHTSIETQFISEMWSEKRDKKVIVEEMEARLRATPSKNFRPYLTIGQFFLDDKASRDFDKAEYYLREAIKRAPNEFDPHFTLLRLTSEPGTSLTQLGYAESTTCLSMRPDLAGVWSAAGGALFQDGVRNKNSDRLALEYIQKALEIDPNYPYAHFGLGNIKYCAGDYKGAEACYARSLQLKPDYTLARVWQALNTTRLGRHQEAAASLDRLLDPKNLFGAPDHYNIACGYSLCAATAAKDGSLKEDSKKLLIQTYSAKAVDAFERALKAGYDNPRAVYSDEDLSSIKDHPRIKALVPR